MVLPEGRNFEIKSSRLAKNALKKSKLFEERQYLKGNIRFYEKDHF